jgi:hypothetical protein
MVLNWMERMADSKAQSTSAHRGGLLEEEVKLLTDDELAIMEGIYDAVDKREAAKRDDS